MFIFNEKTNRKSFENLFEIFTFNHQLICFIFFVQWKTGRGTSIPRDFDPSKQSRNEGLSSFHTSSSFGLFALLPLSGGTDHETLIGGLYGIFVNHQFGLFVLFPLSGRTGCGKPISRNFNFLKQSRNGGLNSLHTSLPFGLFALLPLSGGTSHRTPIEGLFGTFANHQLGASLKSLHTIIINWPVCSVSV